MKTVEEFEAELKARNDAPITDPVAELEHYLKSLWGHGETDDEVRQWLKARGGLSFDGRGLTAWEMVLEGDTSDDDLIRLVLAACQLDLRPRDGATARKWLTEKLEWVHDSFL
jgi:hypothetical protein